MILVFRFDKYLLQKIITKLFRFSIWYIFAAKNNYKTFILFWTCSDKVCVMLNSRICLGLEILDSKKKIRKYSRIPNYFEVTIPTYSRILKAQLELESNLG